MKKLQNKNPEALTSTIKIITNSNIIPMTNIKKKSRNHICETCGRDHQSHKVGNFITNNANEICIMDQEVEALYVFIPLKRLNHKPKNFARLTYNPYGDGRV